MKPEKYNQGKLIDKKLDWKHITTCVKSFQSEHGLVVDGCAGPKTCAKIEETWHDYDDQGIPSQVALLAVSYAKSEIGHGEEHEDNAGIALHKYRDWPFPMDNKGEMPIHTETFERPAGDWCAFFIGWCFEEAMSQSQNKPFSRRFKDKERNRDMPIGSAKSLGLRMLKNGIRVRVPRVGDVVIWDRGKRGSWSGHIGIVSDFDYNTGMIKTVEGNVGKFPAKVREIEWDFTGDRADRIEYIVRV